MRSASFFARRLSIGALAAAAAALLAAPLPAQQTGAVSGVVTTQAGNALESAQVAVVGTGLGTLTGPDGEYRIEEVPAGEQQVRVQLIGYGARTRTVQVSAGQLTEVNFRLSRQAIQLGEIVVTGTGSEGVAKKRLGNTIATINTEQVENAPTLNASEMLAAREPGVQILPASGLSGEGSKIRIRGNASLTQSNEPLIYLDGVRISRGGQCSPFGGFFAGTGGAGTACSSRLDDINPSAIERIEILKGAAAATLYGTEASNGVIQIFTKDGRQGGEARWNVSIEQGLEFMPEDRLVNHADFAGSGLAEERFRRGTMQEQLNVLRNYWGFEDVQPWEVVEVCQMCGFDETGRTTTASLSVNGGGEAITYFASGRYQNLDGIYGPSASALSQGTTDLTGQIGLATDESDRVSGTASINVFPSDEVNVQTRFNYALTDQSGPQTTNNIFGVWSLGYMSQLTLAGEDNWTGAPAFSTVREAAQRTVNQEVNHFGGSVNTSITPSADVTLNLTGGVDYSHNRAEELTPFGWNVDDFTGFAVDGEKEVSNAEDFQITAEARGGWDTDFGPISSAFTLGGQGFLVEQVSRGGQGASFPGPGIEVAGAGADQFILETWTQNVNVGVFAQEQFGYNNWAFLTLGVRFDANSAFGEEFSFVTYPKASGSIVFSDMEGWDSELLSTLRIRGAVGESGLQPGAFDKFRTFGPAPSVEGPGLEPDNLGNPELKPEVTTEWEAGVEFGLFNDRLAFDGTWWTRTTRDALVSKQFPVTGGFLQNQLTNIGTLDAHGFDLNVNGTAYQGDDLNVSLFANASFLHERVTDMGGAPPIKAGGSYPRYRNFIKEGFAPGVFLGATPADVPVPIQPSLTACDPFTEQEALNFFSQPRGPGDFEVFPKNCSGDFLQTKLGKPTPDWSGSFGLDASFLGRFQLHSLFEYKFGDYFVQDLSGGFRQSNAVIGQNTPKAARAISTMMNPGSTAEQRLDAAMTWATELRALAPMSGMNMVHPADFLRWRELSLTYNTPSSFAQSLSLRTLSVSLQTRNLKLWVNDKYTGIDPELNVNARCAEGSRDCNWILSTEGWRMPIPRRLTLAIRAGF